MDRIKSILTCKNLTSHAKVVGIDIHATALDSSLGNFVPVDAKDMGARLGLSESLVRSSLAALKKVGFIKPRSCRMEFEGVPIPVTVRGFMSVCPLDEELNAIVADQDVASDTATENSEPCPSTAEETKSDEAP